MSALPPFPTPTLIDVNGIQLEVFEAGREHRGNPLVLCHGWPEHAYTWRHQIHAFAEAGYHVIVPNQRGYGHSTAPEAVNDYDIHYLTGDLVALLDHFGYSKATFVGHDWGANVVWSLALLHPSRIDRLINLALPYQIRGDQPWTEFLEAILGSDYYMVHFCRQPGVADAVLNANTEQFLTNLFRKNLPEMPPQPGQMMMNLARSEIALGDPILNDEDLKVFSDAFKKNGFTPSINWYRNLDRNWEILGEVDPVIHHPAMMIYGDRDVIPKLEIIRDFVPNIEEVSLDCGHWIPQEEPEETIRVILDWLKKTSKQPI
ncbi:alpha/beta fold hydrolase [Reinekea blandensis]|uniref:Probable ephA protein-Mycobacterium tuberculosis (Strain H37RV) n=1 Tax=Reinekea blandensis MED297 TaxID=314283 RepID=A4BHT1_9GAMM|nr:alpha/beta hydrolase [Reinekea blandensis]EAR08336.1 probable ephA protein-Mycobacterium tuberculosis (strain H37RV) [Reinekea sp. MED297] [Reinekea blandensis MED297]